MKDFLNTVADGVGFLGLLVVLYVFLLCVVPAEDANLVVPPQSSSLNR